MYGDHGIKPKDALHVATAIDARLELFNTFDRTCSQSQASWDARH
jgi:predicted nucleic acid-binding protein